MAVSLQDSDRLLHYPSIMLQLQKVKIVDAAEVEKLRQGDRKGKKKK